MTHKENVQRLNELLAEELEAGIRYMHLAMTLRGTDRMLVRKTMLENMQETFEHAEQIGDKILQLGEIPSLNLNVRLAPVQHSAQEALRTAVTVERAALDAYRELLAKVENEDDVSLEEFIRNQVAIESEHVAELELLLDD